MKFLRKAMSLLILTQMCHLPSSYAGDLYGNPSNPLTSITPDAVVQGNAGDCFLLGAIGSLAQIDPQAIQDMIKDNSDGSYTVTFPGAPDEPIKISFTDADAQYAKQTSHGSWVAILEKAYGVYCSRHFWRRCFLDIFTTEESAKSAESGSITEDGLRILTGGGVRTDCLSFTRYSTIDRQLTAAFAEKRPVTASIGPFSHAGLPSQHEYSVLGYQPNNEDLKMGSITIRNPWGNTGPLKEDGTHAGATFTMTLKEFCSNFTWLAYAETPAPHWQTIVVKRQEVTPLPPGPAGLKWDPIAGIYYNPNEVVPKPVAYDGSTSTEIKPDGTKITTYVDGTKTYEFDNGKKYTEYPDGTRYWEYPDGTKVTVKPDHTEVTEFPGGRRVTELPDGTKIYDGAGGYKITIHPDGHRTVVRPNGEIVETALSSVRDKNSELATLSSGDLHEVAELPDATNDEPSAKLATAINPFEEEVRRGVLTCQLQGDGKTTSHCTLVLANTSRDAQNVDIPAYESFVPAEHGMQIMMLRQKQSFLVAAGATMRAEIPTLCVSTKSLLAPGSNQVKYEPSQYPDAREFKTLLGIIQAGDKLSTSRVYSSVPIAPERRVEALTQFAIWMDLAPRSGRADDLVTSEGIRKSVCDQAGVDPAKLSQEEQKGLDVRINALFSAADLTCKEGHKLSDAKSIALKGQ